MTERGPDGRARRHCAERDDVAWRVDDGPSPYAIYPWLFVGLSAVLTVVRGDARPVWASGPLVAVFFLLAVVAIWRGLRRGQGDRLALALLAAQGVDAFTLVGWFGPRMGSVFPLLAMVCGIVLPWGRRPWSVFVIMPVSVAAALVGRWGGASAGEAFAIWYGTLLSGFVIAMFLRLFAAIKGLRETREELARTAVSEERLRFARDLHDLLGHTLSVMVVKAQVVRRLAARDPGLTAGQAADIEAIGREALRQVRLAVSGYRGHGLDAEIAGARAALRDAGIEAQVRREAAALPDEAGVMLGWAVREGVTNVIRHSGARRCEITVARRDGAAVLSVRDDGRGGPAPGTAPGNGLRGLVERIGAAGGRLDAGRAEGGGFALTVTLPLDDDGDDGGGTGEDSPVTPAGRPAAGQDFSGHEVSGGAPGREGPEREGPDGRGSPEGEARGQGTPKERIS